MFFMECSFNIHIVGYYINQIFVDIYALYIIHTITCILHSKISYLSYRVNAGNFGHQVNSDVHL